MISLRPYQEALRDEVLAHLRPGCNVLAVLPTGGGKTVIMADIVHRNLGAAAVIAHRSELVGQIAKALNQAGVRHRIIAPEPVIRQIISECQRDHGHSLYDSNALAGVVSVDTLVSKTGMVKYKRWADSVTLVLQDEAHHMLKSNKWGRAALMFPQAKLLGVTATPCRADGAGLGAHADGLFHRMAEGPSMAWLIKNNYLTPYKVFCPPGFDRAALEIAISATTGDYKPGAAKEAVAGHMGDIVPSYLKYASGKRGICFAVDVEAAAQIAKSFSDSGVRAEVVSAKTPDALRSSLINQFRLGQITILVNVDLFGEGFDVPAVEVVIMDRPTESYSLFSQQFGRALRILDGKTHAIIIDHVGNVARHMPPDMRPWQWTLDAVDRKKRGATDTDPMRICKGCSQPFEAFYKACPYCGHIDEPTDEDRKDIKRLLGDMTELSVELLNELREQILAADRTPEQYERELLMGTMPKQYVSGAVRKYAAKYEARRLQLEQYEQIADLWGGMQLSRGLQLPEAYRRFYLLHGMDVLTARAQDNEGLAAITARLAEDIAMEMMK